MPTESSDNIPGVDDRQLALVAESFLRIPNIRAEPADRFAQAVRTLVEKRAQANWPNEGESDLAVFVMVDRPRQIGERHGAKPFVDPRAKDDPLLGRLFFANGDASAGRSMPIPTEPDAVLEWLDDSGLGNSPIVTAYRESKEMFTRRSGTWDVARIDSIRDREPSATLSELMKALDHFHQRLLTPTSCPEGVWERGRAHEYVPGPKPEKSIQSALELALNFWFRGIVKAESEDNTNIGRIDVRLLRKSANEGSLTYWVIMELKVIKCFTNPKQGYSPSRVSTSTNIEAIVKGVRQAGSYQQNRYAEKGLLEIYDLRKNKTNNLKKQREVLTAKNRFSKPPKIHVWPVFGSSEDARASGFTGT